MKYYSLNNPDYKVTFREAVRMGQAPDKGLFFPEELPALSGDFIRNWKGFTKEEIAFRVIRPFVSGCIGDEELMTIVSETVDFDFPLKEVESGIFTLELFHGPTGAFKDVGARFLSRCLQSFAKKSDKKITILVATSGDTGGAVADAFYNVEGVDVIILFPKGKVSPLQEKQLTTYDGNIRALEIKGTFDDCQAAVKQAFADDDLKGEYDFSSANSINIARWLSQQFYYFYALQQWPLEQAPVISVPSGNFGNICAGLVARKTGLRIDSLIAACNTNDVFTSYLNSGVYHPRKAVATISNAMDIGDPSNFRRVLQLFDRDFEDLKKVIYSYSFGDDDTRSVISDVFHQQGYLLDPHGAVGYLALKKHLSEHSGKQGIFFETAHPAKFANTVEAATGQKTAMPERMKNLFEKRQSSTVLPSGYNAFKEFLLAETLSSKK